MLRILMCSTLCLLSLQAAQAQNNLYFPPTGNSWETLAPAELGFCPDRIDSLYQFLETRQTKSFLLLKDGKIVLEKYFGTFKQDSVWYWASAGKSLSAYLMGIALEQNNVQLNNPASSYLGNGWTVAPPDKESLIKVKDLLSMTSGLDDNPMVPGVADPSNCLQPACLQYKADAGSRWAYHNAPYHLSHEVIEAASNQTINQFTQARLWSKIGGAGLWVNHVMYSNTRNMARFGLLALAKGVWKQDTLIHNSQYVQQMTQPSQQLNKSYGYLWWLNGQSSFMLPGLQLMLPGKLFPNAPSDLYAALGKNDQKIHVVPSKGWVVIRMGNDAGYTGPNGGQVPIYFDNDLWSYLNALTCASSTQEESTENAALIYPNPAQDVWQIDLNDTFRCRWSLFNAQGARVDFGQINGSQLQIDAHSLPKGIYWWRAGTLNLKLVKI
jgi:CubicO group peptidase (beta-lactamase class C family)